MSEPPEQEEEEPAADADLAELLEQFREPEEAPRPRANPLWFVSAILLSVLGIWLALRASGGEAEDKPESAALAGAMLPGKTSERLPRGEETVDVVEDYLARCKKGMTAQEVRWIVEDFQRAGLDWEGELATDLAQIFELLRNEGGRPPRAQERERIESLAKQLGHRQRKWFGDTLAAALKLDLKQEREMRQNLAAAMEKDWVELLRAREEGEAQEAEGQRNYFGHSIYYLGFIEDWIEKPEYAPWKLTSLTEAQLALTSFESQDDAVVWLRKPSSPAVEDSPKPQDADAGGEGEGEGTNHNPGDEGILIHSPSDVLDGAMRLHPAHLRMDLLRRFRSQPFLDELEKRGE